MKKDEETKNEILQGATLQDFVAKKLKREENKDSTIDVTVTSMNRKITLKKPSEERVYEYSDDIGNNSDLRVVVEANRKLIYDCCPELQNTQLHEALGIKDPYDVPRVLFEIEEVKEIMNQFNKIIGKTSMGEKIKN